MYQFKILSFIIEYSFPSALKRCLASYGHFTLEPLPFPWYARTDFTQTNTKRSTVDPRLEYEKV